MFLPSNWTELMCPRPWSSLGPLEEMVLELMALDCSKGNFPFESNTPYQKKKKKGYLQLDTYIWDYYLQ